MKGFAVNVKVQNIYFLDRAAVRIVLKNDKADFSVKIQTEIYFFIWLIRDSGFLNMFFVTMVDRSGKVEIMDIQISLS